MTDFVFTWFKPVFEAMGLASSQPGELENVSEWHLNALADVMDTLHDALEAAIKKEKEMAVPLASIETMRPGHRPDDVCVDFMARAVVEATGSTMPGQPRKHRRQDCTVSKNFVFDQELARSFRVMGPLQTEEFRGAVRPPKATSESKKRKAGEIGQIDPEILAMREGTAESCEDALRRLHSLVTCRAGLACGMGLALVPSKLLLFSTHAKHTTLVELWCSEQTADKARQLSAATTEWSICVHDSLESKSKLDSLLQDGLNQYLSEYGNKTGYFRHVKQPQMIKQEDDIVCSLMAICRLILKLTGEELPPCHWTPCVQIIRTFFDLWLFLGLEGLAFTVEQGSRRR